jgi:hypothetical protein
MLAPTPLELGETAPALDRGDVSLTGQAGYGSGADRILAVSGSGPAVAARVRVGVGGDQEVGLEGLWGSVTTSGNAFHQYDGQFGGAKASYKRAIVPWFAVVAGAGFGTSHTGTSVGGDVATLVSMTGVVRPYAGVRLGFAARVTGDGAGGPVFAVPVGICLQPHPAVGLFAEAGAFSSPAGNGNTGAFYASGGLKFTLTKFP